VSPHGEDGDIAVTGHQTGCVRFKHSAFPMDFSTRFTQFPRAWYRYWRAEYSLHMKGMNLLCAD
jgi:hypothetical protein